MGIRAMKTEIAMLARTAFSIFSEIFWRHKSLRRMPMPSRTPVARKNLFDSSSFVWYKLGSGQNYNPPKSTHIFPVKIVRWSTAHECQQDACLSGRTQQARHDKECVYE